MNDWFVSEIGTPDKIVDSTALGYNPIKNIVRTGGEPYGTHPGNQY